MFLRRIERRKNGKTHLYWSLVENKRLDGGGVVQRHVLYLGEINSSQAEVFATFPLHRRERRGRRRRKRRELALSPASAISFSTSIADATAGVFGRRS